MYVIIGTTEDGSFIESLTKDEIELRINNKYYGENITFLTEIPSVALEDWPGKAVLIIRADAFVVPHADTRSVID